MPVWAYPELDLAWNVPFIDHTTLISPTQAIGLSGRTFRTFPVVSLQIRPRDRTPETPFYAY